MVVDSQVLGSCEPDAHEDAAQARSALLQYAAKRGAVFSPCIAPANKKAKTEQGVDELGGSGWWKAWRREVLRKESNVTVLNLEETNRDLERPAQHYKGFWLEENCVDQPATAAFSCEENNGLALVTPTPLRRNSLSAPSCSGDNKKESSKRARQKKSAGSNASSSTADCSIPARSAEASTDCNFFRSCIDVWRRKRASEGGNTFYKEEPGPGERRGDPAFRHPYVQELLGTARTRVREVLDDLAIRHEYPWIICVRTYGRAGNPVEGNWPRRSRLAGKGVLNLTLKALEQALGRENAIERTLLFVSHEDPDFVSGRLTAALKGTAWEQRVVVGVKGADLQVRFIEEAFPSGAHAVVADDNITEFVVELQPRKNRTLDADKDEGELIALINRAGPEMRRQQANIWSLNASHNHRFLFAEGERVRKNMRKCNAALEQCDFNTKLGLIYGAFFGLRVMHDAARYSRYGQVKDDVERSLRYWHLDKKMLRFKRYGVAKTHPPGKFIQKKGGISTGSSEEKHEAEKQHALKSMLEEFASTYARLPATGEKAPTGVIFFQGQRAYNGIPCKYSHKKKKNQETVTPKLRRLNRKSVVPSPSLTETPKKVYHNQRTATGQFMKRVVD